MNSSVNPKGALRRGGWRETRTKKPCVWQEALGFFILGKVLKRIERPLKIESGRTMDAQRFALVYNIGKFHVFGALI